MFAVLIFKNSEMTVIVCKFYNLNFYFLYYHFLSEPNHNVRAFIIIAYGKEFYGST